MILIKFCLYFSLYCFQSYRVFYPDSITSEQRSFEYDLWIAMKHSNFNQSCQHSVHNLNTRFRKIKNKTGKASQKSKSWTFWERKWNESLAWNFKMILFLFIKSLDTSHLIPIKLSPSNHSIGSISCKMMTWTWAQKRIKGIVNSNLLSYPFQSLLHFTPSPLSSLKNFHNPFWL